MDDIKRKIYKEFKLDKHLSGSSVLLQERNRPILFVSDTSLTPPTDVWETTDEIYVVMEIAGMDLKKLKIEYSAGYLIVEGERNEPELFLQTTIVKFHKKEIDYGHFRVKIKMNTRIKTDEIEAQYNEGMLTVVLKKDPQTGEDVNISVPVQKS